MSAEEGPAIGIDFGNATSCVAVYHHGKVEIISNDQGNRTTPSCVAFTNSEHFIGETAKKIMSKNPANTIYDVKRLIGRGFEDPDFQADMKMWPFEVINSQTKPNPRFVKGGKPKIVVDYKGEKKAFFPEEIASMIHVKMKEIAEAHLGKKVTKAVISVPACFNDSQRRAVMDAGTIAGLRVLRIINEPSAAAIAYAFHEKDDRERTILVLDVGGGSCDASVVTVKSGAVEVKSTRGNAHLGGDDFTRPTVDYFVEKFKKKFKKDLSTNKSALRLLRTACEQAKILLSSSWEAPVEFDSLFEYINLKSSEHDFEIFRDRFEDDNEDVFFSILELVQLAIQDAGMDESQIDEIVLAGGSTKTPKLMELLQGFMNDMKPNNSINPTEIVAYGAAIQAAILQGDNSEALKDFTLVDVTSNSEGVSVIGGIMKVLIRRNTPIPAVSAPYRFCTNWFDQKYIDLPIYEGERVQVDKNRLLGQLLLVNIHPAPKGVPKIEVTFNVDADGLLNVTAVQENAGAESKVIISYYDGRLKEEEIVGLVADAKRFRQEDLHHREFVKARDALKSYCLDVRSRFGKEIEPKCKEILESIIYDKLASKEDVEEKKKEIDRFLDDNFSIDDSESQPKGNKRQRKE